MTASVDPCAWCGAPARLVKTTLPRRLSEEHAEVVDTRVCTSPTCDTIAPPGERPMAAGV